VTAGDALVMIDLDLDAAVLGLICNVGRFHRALPYAPVAPRTRIKPRLNEFHAAASVSVVCVMPPSGADFLARLKSPL
jgi:hypothetical protein